MKRTWVFLSLLSTLGWISPAWAGTKAPEDFFSLVQGTVKVAGGGGSVRRVAKGDGVYPGESIQVGAKSQAQVTLFDGSTLDLSANSKLTLNQLQQPSQKDKVISLKLALGKVFAQVRKLFSSKSSFEIEAGGVVCGVRGTAFSMDFNPQTKSLDLNVLEGKVSAFSEGNTLFFTAGQSGHFLNGQFTGNGGSNNTGAKTGGKGNAGGGTSNSSNGNNNSNGNNSSSNNSGGNSNGSGGSGAGSTENNGGTNPETGGNSNNPNPGTTTEVSPASSLEDLNTQFTSGILINGENNLNQSQQSIQIHIIVPPGEAVP